MWSTRAPSTACLSCQYDDDTVRLHHPSSGKQVDNRAPIGSKKPHGNDLDVYFVEISPANLAPYVIGFERSFFHEIRTFALDRMDSVRVLDERYEVPADFDPHAYLSSAWGIVAGPPLEVVTPSHADLKDQPISEPPQEAVHLD